MSSLREHIERCEHAVDEPDWAGLRELYPELYLVCPFEDCPYPVDAGDPDCGNHEEWMT